MYVNKPLTISQKMDHPPDYSTYYGTIKETETEAKDVSKKVMNDETFTNWIAIAFIIGVIGQQFSQRPNISTRARLAIDTVSLLITLFILIWTSLARFAAINIFVSDALLIIVIILACGLVASLIVTTNIGVLG
jgi:hypothetical protein